MTYTSRQAVLEQTVSGKKMIELAVAARAMQDLGFRRRLMEDPSAALEEFGLKLPAQMRVQVVEEPANTLRIALPPQPTENQLLDEELDALAAGLWSWSQVADGVVSSIKRTFSGSHSTARDSSRT